ncbi:hypothetical protein OOJ91_07175 [Micromonospora lupini]|uniref:effector-associated constant component EACC1 n=1 Tax=Micromonospora lupini TaxID=285679 RepID=UPI00225729CA|nr:hypothetical protein [Micromonospora lupini]MCX5065661.1 hypothetical protein [Micromonospora lupini]
MAFPFRNGDYRRVYAKIALGNDVAHELASLYSWLQRDDEFRGRVKTVTAELKPGDMGGVTAMLTVALGSGGAVAALGGTLNAWIAARRTKVSVEITNGGYACRVEIDTANASAAAELLRKAIASAGGLE